jgi:hypothetical protein
MYLLYEEMEKLWTGQSLDEKSAPKGYPTITARLFAKLSESGEICV